MRVKVALGIAVCLASSTAYAGDCVKIRNGKDGYDCMKFSRAERNAAANFGLRLGDSYKTVKHVLGRRGWVVDPDWLKRIFSYTGPLEDGELICGSGYDAVCSVAYTKSRKHVYLTLSGTDEETSLIGVATKP